jgi:tetratricopeptide (TPR) repeat protein
LKNLGILFACLFGTCPAPGQDQAGLTLAAMEPVAGMERQLYDPFDGATMSGNYLAGRFAQQHHDWSRASVFMDAILAGDNTDAQLVKRAMVIAMGSGNTEKAIELSAKLLELEADSSLALLFLAVDAFKKNDFAGANEFLKRVPANGSSDFIVPVLKSWADAAQGKYKPDQLQDTTVHIYHAIMIADFMKEHSHVVKLLDSAMANESITPADMERVADIYAHINKPEKAIALYKKVLEAAPDNAAIAAKLVKLQNGESLNLYDPINSAADGVAMALYDMAQSLYQEYSDDSARVFAHMVIHLKPDLTKANQMLAEISARHGQFAEAIVYYHSIKSDSEDYIEARRRAAELLEESGKTEEALAELDKLIASNSDLESMIQIGDIYRRKEEFSPAIEYYNQAAATFKGEIPAEYWHLYYVRGMCYERVGQWSKAEADLTAALSFQPEHPFVLNYLGYAWADQGQNLDNALGMIRKAVTLRPADGYITDSLGWVLYRMGEHQDAVPHLEKAVELLPYDPVINDHLGDAYWKVGRKLEARFQWQRAKENSEDLQLIGKLDGKLASGITSDDVKQAEIAPPDADAIINR